MQIPASLSLEELTRIVALALFLSLCIGPWTIDVYSALAVGEFESFAVIDMAVWLLGRMWLTFYTQWSLLAVPLLLVCCRAAFPRALCVAQWLLILLAECASVIGLPLLVAVQGREHGVHPLGNVLLSDVFGMVCIHAALIAARILPAWSFLCGPLYGLCYTIRLPEDRRYSSLLSASLILYLNIGALHRGYRLMKDLYGESLFQQTHSFDEWLGAELYAGLTVVLGYAVIVVSLPAPHAPVCSWRGFATIVELMLYIVLLNANVGSAWIVSRGIVRPSLHRPFLVRCVLPASWQT